MNNIRAVDKLNATELATGLAGTSASWHAQYRDSAFIYAGGFPLSLTEGDLVCIFSQYGEILHVHLARDRDSGKSKGFAWIKYADQRSTDMAVDNLNGIKVLDRVVRVDHAAQFKRHELKDEDHGDEARRMREIEEIVGGNVAPEIWNKSLREMEEVVARRFGSGEGGADPNKNDKGKKSKKHRKRGADEDGGGASDSDVSDTGLDPEDPMYKYLKEAKKELKREKREKRRAKKEAKAAAAVGKSKSDYDSDRHRLTRRAHRSRPRSRSRSPPRRRPGSRERDRDEYRSAPRSKAEDYRGSQSSRQESRSDRGVHQPNEHATRRDHGRERGYESRERERDHDRYERHELR